MEINEFAFPHHGHGIRSLLESRNMSQRELAAMTTLSSSYISSVLQGSRPISVNGNLRVVEHKGGLPLNELWLLLRMNTDGEIKYMLSNAPLTIPLEELVKVSKMRWSIEQLFQEGKDFLGLDEYEMRSYPGWHRHMAMVNVTMHFLFTVRLDFGLKKTILPCPSLKN